MFHVAMRDSARPRTPVRGGEEREGGREGEDNEERKRRRGGRRDGRRRNEEKAERGESESRDETPWVSKDCADFLDACFARDPSKRPSVDVLLKHRLVEEVTSASSTRRAVTSPSFRPCWTRSSDWEAQAPVDS
eukprot:763224-Hanusia_phi.AAC.3